jgi:hypothetical protein
LALRIDRAANDLNPILVVMTIGLLLLNLTLYLGMWASQGPIAWTAPHQIGSESAPAPPPESLGYGR